MLYEAVFKLKEAGLKLDVTRVGPKLTQSVYIIPLSICLFVKVILKHFQKVSLTQHQILLPAMKKCGAKVTFTSNISSCVEAF